LHGRQRTRAQTIRSLPDRLGPGSYRQLVSDAVEPSGYRLLPTRGGGFASQREKGRLEQVLGVLVVVKNPPAHAEHQRTVPPDERSKGHLVALAGIALQQLAIALLPGRGNGEQGFNVAQKIFQLSADHGSSSLVRVLYQI